MLKLQSANSTTVLQTYASAGGLTLSTPQGVCLDSSLNLYVVDTGNNRVVKFSNNSSALHINRTDWRRQELQLFTTPLNSGPSSVAVDQYGVVFVAANSVNYIVVFTPGGVQLSRLAVGGGVMALNQPLGIAVDGSGMLCVADSVNSRVVVLATQSGSSGGGGLVSSSSSSPLPLPRPPRHPARVPAVLPHLRRPPVRLPPLPVAVAVAAAQARRHHPFHRPHRLRGRV